MYGRIRRIQAGFSQEKKNNDEDEEGSINRVNRSWIRNKVMQSGGF